eukprot:scaffold78159_cov64-Phaeocystis_antarctica.AAC.6
MSKAGPAWPASAAQARPASASASLGQPRPASASLGQPRPASASLGQPQAVPAFGPPGKAISPAATLTLDPSRQGHPAHAGPHLEHTRRRGVHPTHREGALLHGFHATTYDLHPLADPDPVPVPGPNPNPTPNPTPNQDAAFMR